MQPGGTRTSLVSLLHVLVLESFPNEVHDVEGAGHPRRPKDGHLPVSSLTGGEHDTEEKDHRQRGENCFEWFHLILN